MKIIAPKVGGSKLADGSMLAADRQLSGTPSVLFAVAVSLSDKRAKALAVEGAAIDFVRDAFCHLKAIAVAQGCQARRTGSGCCGYQRQYGIYSGSQDAPIGAGKVRSNLGLKEMYKFGKSSNSERRKAIMRNKEEGKIGWILLWLVGIPIPILLVLFFLRGCT